MVVSPASEREVGDDGDAIASTERSRRERLVLLVAGIVVAACLISLVVLLTVRDSGSDTSTSATERDREDIMSVSQQFVLRLGTFGPADLNEERQMPEWIAGVSDLLTTKFGAGFVQAAEVREAAVAEQGLRSVAKVYIVGVSSQEGDSATALVGGTLAQSYPATGNTKQRLSVPLDQFRFNVKLVKVKGEWLVDDFDDIDGADVDENAVPGASATPGGGQ